MSLVERATRARRVILPMAGTGGAENGEGLQLQLGKLHASPDDQASPYDPAPNPVERLKKSSIAARGSGANGTTRTADRKDFAQAAHLIGIEKRKSISRIRSSSLPKSMSVLHNIVLRQIASGHDKAKFLPEFAKAGIAHCLVRGIGA